MSEQDPKAVGDAANATPEPTEDRLKNLQAETQRKIENLNAQLNQSNLETKAQLESILAVMQSRQESGKSTATQEKKLSELIYDDPDAAINQITRQVTQQVTGQVAAQQALGNTAAQLESEYPELADRSSEHYKRVQSYYSQLPRQLQGTKEGLENAALKAVADFGLVPKSKRSNPTTDDFSLGGSPSGSRSSNRGGQSKKKDMTDSQKQFAQLLNAPVNDPKFKAIFEKANSRTDWNKYKGDDE